MIKAGIFGYPIAQSKSPLIHGHWLDHHGINGTYEKFEVAPENFKAEILARIDEGYAGLNTTVPHKEAAFEISDHLTERGIEKAVELMKVEVALRACHRAQGRGVHMQNARLRATVDAIRAPPQKLEL